MECLPGMLQILQIDEKSNLFTYNWLLDRSPNQAFKGRKKQCPFLAKSNNAMSTKIAQAYFYIEAHMNFLTHPKSSPVGEKVSTFCNPTSKPSW